jgi:hypothetical protein
LNAQLRWVQQRYCAKVCEFDLTRRCKPVEIKYLVVVGALFDSLKHLLQFKIIGADFFRGILGTRAWKLIGVIRSSHLPKHQTSKPLMLLR